jgi:DNA-binding protein YbaB
VVDKDKEAIQKRVAAALEDAKKTLQNNLNSRS